MQRSLTARVYNAYESKVTESFSKTKSERTWGFADMIVSSFYQVEKRVKSTEGASQGKRAYLCMVMTANLALFSWY